MLSVISTKKIKSHDICSMVWMLINNSSVIYYLMLSSFVDIRVSILCSSDARRDIKLVEGESDKRFLNYPWSWVAKLWALHFPY